MYKISIENKKGDRLELTHNSNYTVTATGLNPVASNIVTAPVANYGGERYVSSRQQKRNIVLNIYVHEPVETNRINLYKYIKSRDWIRVYYKNNTRDVYIDGYVESFELNHFDRTQTAQVSIICPQPNFIDMNINTLDNYGVVDMFSFPFNTLLSSNLIRGGKSLIDSNNILDGKDKWLDWGVRGHANNGEVYDEFINPSYEKYVKVLVSDSPIEFKRVAMYFKCKNRYNENETHYLWTVLFVRSKSRVYGGETADTATTMITSDTWYSNEYYYGAFSNVQSSDSHNTSTNFDITIDEVNADYFIGLYQSENLKNGVVYNKASDVLGLLNTHIITAWINSTIDNDENVTRISGTMSSYTGTNPAGVSDEMCKIDVLSNSSLLEFHNCIPSEGTYTVHLWIKSNTTNNSVWIFNSDFSFNELISSRYDWTEWTFTFNSASADSLYLGLNGANTYYVYKVMLEYGDKSHTYVAYGDNGELIKIITFGRLDESMTAFINNSSDDEIGFIYTIHCKGEVTNPVIHLNETNQIFKINKRFKMNDIITIDTRRGKKSVTVDYMGVETNLFNYVDDSSKWLQLQSGYNHISQGASSGSEFMISTITYTNEYEGV